MSSSATGMPQGLGMRASVYWRSTASESAMKKQVGWVWPSLILQVRYPATQSVGCWVIYMGKGA